MIPLRYYRFEVEILNREFVYDASIAYEKTALVTFFNEKNHRLHTEDYGYIPMEDLYERVHKEKCLVAPKCFLKNFSLTAFRRLYLLGKHDYVELESVDLSACFFDAVVENDFSYLKIEEGDVSFNAAHFARGNLNFSYGSYGFGGVDFSNLFVRSLETDFSNTHFGVGDVSFKNAVFVPGLKNFQYAEFGAGEVSFVNVDFGGGELRFVNTDFGPGFTSFKVTDFGEGSVSFYFARFGEGDLSFERANFNKGEVDFRKVEFGVGRVNFNRSEFGDGDVSFEAAGATGKVSFKRTRFSTGAKNFEMLEFMAASLNMERTHWGAGRISFNDAQLKHLGLTGCHLNSYVDLRVRKCADLDVSNTLVRDIVDLSPTAAPVGIEALNLTGMRLLGVLYVDWEGNDILRLIARQGASSHREKAEQFRLLKENFNGVGQYEQEDKAYVWFKRYELKGLYHDKGTSIARKLLYIPNVLFQKLVFDYMGLYATNPMRVLTSMLLVYVLFSLTYILALLFGVGDIVSGIGGEHDHLSIVGRSFYHSGVTFLTIGYGDFHPLGLVRVLSNVEGFVGVFMMSYFTVAFVRKILR